MAQTCYISTKTSIFCGAVASAPLGYFSNSIKKVFFETSILIFCHLQGVFINITYTIALKSIVRLFWRLFAFTYISYWLIKKSVLKSNLVRDFSRVCIHFLCALHKICWHDKKEQIFVKFCQGGWVFTHDKKRGLLAS